MVSVPTVEGIHKSAITASLPKGENWEIFSVKTVYDLQKLEESAKFREVLVGCKLVIYLVGSRDIMEQCKAAGPNSIADVNGIFSSLSASCERIKSKKPVLIITLPPNNIPETWPVSSVYNTMIVNELGSNNCKYIVIDNQEDYTMVLKRKLVLGDSISLSIDGASYITKALSLKLSQIKLEEFTPEIETSSGPSRAALTDTTNSQPVAHTESSSSKGKFRQVAVQIPTDMIRHIIGRGQKTRIRIENESNTKVEIKKWKVDGEEKDAAVIRGHDVAVEKAVKIIQSIVNEQKSKVVPGKRESKDECRYYKEGTCFRGEVCPFMHSDTGGPIQPQTKVIKLE